ncbi:hypothetical protein L9F63_021441, partial [Diploptera punctata]
TLKIYQYHVIVIYLAINWFTQKPKNFPPGPPMLPLIGSLPFMPRNLIHYTMAGEWRKKYGPVVGCSFGTSKMVAVCGPQEVLEVLRRDEFQGRPKGDFFKERSFNKYLGVFFSDGPFWVEQRRFTLRHLRDFGFGKKSMQDLILDESVVSCGNSVPIRTATGMFAVSTLNVLWGMLAGTRYSRDDAELKDLLEKLTKNFRSGIVGHTESMKNLRDMQNFFRKSIQNHKTTIDETYLRDFTDAYLKEMKIQQNNPDTTFT